MKLNEVVSSNIKSIGYDKGTLVIEYLSGAQYEYYDVPQEVYDELVKAESKGRFVNQNIKGKYKFQKKN